MAAAGPTPTGDGRPVAVVTGGGRAIGRVIAGTLAARGYDLVLGARHRADLEDAASAIAARGGRAVAVPCDVTDADAVAALAARADEAFHRVDVVVANAGIPGPSAPLAEVPDEAWAETFDVNTAGVFRTCRAFLPLLVRQGGGSIVVIGSVTGKRPLRDRTPYAASKLALVGLVRTLAVEVGGHGVRVNVVSPGAVAGPRIDWVIQEQARARGLDPAEVRAEFTREAPLGRLVTAEEVAEVVAFLASPAARAITGQDINVNCGLAMY